MLEDVSDPLLEYHMGVYNTGYFVTINSPTVKILMKYKHIIIISKVSDVKALTECYITVTLCINVHFNVAG